MKHLSNDDKETLIILFAISFMTVAAFAVILTSIRPRSTATPKHYDLSCVTNYVKYPLKECEYKESK